MNEIKALDNKPIYKGLDLFKFIAALLIVLLHTIETSNFYANEVKFVATRFAVPFFFIVSGFFLYLGLSKAKDKKTYILKYEKKLLLTFLFWAVLIYSPFIIKSYIESNSDQSTIRIIALLFRKMFIVGPGPYWFILVLIITAFILYVLDRINNDMLLYGVIAFSFVCLIIYSNFRGVFSDIPIIKYGFKLTDFVYSWEFNFLMYGIPFMGLGFVFAKKDAKMNVNIALIVFIVSTALRVFEYNLANIFEIPFFEDNNISLLYIVQAASVFMIGKEITPKISIEQSKQLRQCSSFMYYIHVILLYNLLDIILDKKFGDVIYSYKWIAPKFMVIVIFCVLLFIIIKKINNKHLNFLING